MVNIGIIVEPLFSKTKPNLTSHPTQEKTSLLALLRSSGSGGSGIGTGGLIAGTLLGVLLGGGLGRRDNGGLLALLALLTLLALGIGLGVGLILLFFGFCDCTKTIII